MSKLIVLDAGHGGKDPGATNGRRQESNDVLKLAKAVEKLLKAQGCTVLMTRTADTYVSLADRTTAANRAGADLFVSLHRNSFTNATANANGMEVWVYTTAGAVDEAAAGAVLEQLAAVGIQSNRGVKKGNYHVLRETNMTSTLVELGFISNTIDNRLFDERFGAYAEAIARGVCGVLGVAYGAGGVSRRRSQIQGAKRGVFGGEQRPGLPGAGAGNGAGGVFGEGRSALAERE